MQSKDKYASPEIQGVQESEKGRLKQCCMRSFLISKQIVFLKKKNVKRVGYVIAYIITVSAFENNGYF